MAPVTCLSTLQKQFTRRNESCVPKGFIAGSRVAFLERRTLPRRQGRGGLRREEPEEHTSTRKYTNQSRGKHIRSVHPQPTSNQSINQATAVIESHQDKIKSDHITSQSNRTGHFQQKSWQMNSTQTSSKKQIYQLKPILVSPALSRSTSSDVTEADAALYLLLYIVLVLPLRRLGLLLCQ